METCTHSHVCLGSTRVHVFININIDFKSKQVPFTTDTSISLKCTLDGESSTSVTIDYKDLQK